MIFDHRTIYLFIFILSISLTQSVFLNKYLIEDIPSDDVSHTPYLTQDLLKYLSFVCQPTSIRRDKLMENLCLTSIYSFELQKQREEEQQEQEQQKRTKRVGWTISV